MKIKETFYDQIVNVFDLIIIFLTPITNIKKYE